MPFLPFGFGDGTYNDPFKPGNPGPSSRRSFYNYYFRDSDELPGSTTSPATPDSLDLGKSTVLPSEAEAWANRTDGTITPRNK
jgi:hypothetical protein